MPSWWRNKLMPVKKKIVQRTNNRAAGVVELEKSEIWNYLALVTLFQITTTFKTYFCFRACFHFKWKWKKWYLQACSYLAFASIFQHIQHKGIASHKADQQLIISLTAISMQIRSYNSINKQTMKLIILLQLSVELTYQLSNFSFSRHFHVLLSW